MRFIKIMLVLQYMYSNALNSGSKRRQKYFALARGDD